MLLVVARPAAGEGLLDLTVPRIPGESGFGAPRWRLVDTDSDSETDPDEEDDPLLTGPYPQVTLELGAAVVGFVPTQVKVGPEPEATGVDPFDEASKPTTLSFAYTAYLDVKVLSWGGFGGFYWYWGTEGPRRRIHRDGIHLGGTQLPGRTRVRTRIEIQHAEVNMRYVWAHTETIYLWFGVGASWVRYRLGLAGSGLRASGKVENFWGPAWTYFITGRVPGSKLWAYLTSAIALSPTKFPSIVTHSRMGFRYQVTESLGVSIGTAVHSGYITDIPGITRRHVTKSYRHERARWSVITLEMGVSVRF